MQLSLNINWGYIRAALASARLCRPLALLLPRRSAAQPGAAGRAVTEEDSEHVAFPGLIEHNTIDCCPLSPHLVPPESPFLPPAPLLPSPHHSLTLSHMVNRSPVGFRLDDDWDHADEANLFRF